MRLTFNQVVLRAMAFTTDPDLYRSKCKAIGQRTSPENWPGTDLQPNDSLPRFLSAYAFIHPNPSRFERN